jgi:hypothetical protein
MKKIIIIFATIVMVLSGCVSCQFSPGRTDFSCEECFISDSCLYRVEGNKDKSICGTLAKSCDEAMKEKRNYERFKFCKDPKNLPKGWDLERCKMFLNQR